MSLLPLFPLDVVLLPGTSLPLHIFEPRYREMTAECLAQKKPFGVVRSQEETVSEIGCTAEIMTVAKQYPDGRSDIVTRGVQRFEILQVNQERSFLQAEVFFLDDEPGTATAAEVEKAVKLHVEMMTLAGAKAEGGEETSRQLLSFYLAGSLPLDLDFKQTLLAMKSESERIRAVISYFEAILPTIKRTIEVRHKAGGNGHVV
jgi:Lon protease-like protein